MNCQRVSASFACGLLLLGVFAHTTFGRAQGVSPSALTGTVSSKSGDEIVLEVAGKNSWGNHVTGTVRVALQP